MHPLGFIIHHSLGASIFGLLALGSLLFIGAAIMMIVLSTDRK